MEYQGRGVQPRAWNNMAVACRRADACWPQAWPSWASPLGQASGACDAAFLRRGRRSHNAASQAGRGAVQTYRGRSFSRRGERRLRSGDRAGPGGPGPRHGSGLLGVVTWPTSVGSPGGAGRWSASPSGPAKPGCPARRAPLHGWDAHPLGDPQSTS
jgi:hypothetical protein